MENVSVKQFREYYHLEEETVPDNFLQGYIKERAIAMSDLTQRDWAAVAKSLFSRGVTYGHNITTMISKKYRFVQSEKDFEKATHIILQMEMFENNGLSEPRYFVIDREENILYYSNKEIRLDYTKAEASVSLSDEDVDRLINQLQKSITPQWEIPFGLGELSEYHWDLFIILPHEEMIWYNGDGREEKYRPGFEKWYQCLYKEMKNA